jgi:hypothetical protein
MNLRIPAISRRLAVLIADIALTDHPKFLADAKQARDLAQFERDSLPTYAVIPGRLGTSWMGGSGATAQLAAGTAPDCLRLESLTSWESAATACVAGSLSDGQKRRSGDDQDDHNQDRL